jgi:hypothetical protein
MRFIIALTVVWSASLIEAVPIAPSPFKSDEKPVNVSNYVLNPDGSFHYLIWNPNGIGANVSSVQVGRSYCWPCGPGIQIQGKFSFFNPELKNQHPGQPGRVTSNTFYEVNWTAGYNGFVPNVVLPQPVFQGVNPGGYDIDPSNDLVINGPNKKGVFSYSFTAPNGIKVQASGTPLPGASHPPPDPKQAGKYGYPVEGFCPNLELGPISSEINVDHNSDDLQLCVVGNGPEMQGVYTYVPIIHNDPEENPTWGKVDDNGNPIRLRVYWKAGVNGFEVVKTQEIPFGDESFENPDLY